MFITADVGGEVATDAQRGELGPIRAWFESGDRDVDAIFEHSILTDDDYPDEDAGYSLLMLAAAGPDYMGPDYGENVKARVEVVRYLIARGADVDLKAADFGWSPLHHAVLS